MDKVHILAEIRVNNAGLDFSDDVDTVEFIVPENVTRQDVARALKEADSILRKEDENGECLYNLTGYNYDTLASKVCEENEGWTWQHVVSDVSFTIE